MPGRRMLNKCQMSKYLSFSIFIFIQIMAQLREEKISVYEFPSDEVIIFQLFSFHATLKSEYKSPICNILSSGAQMIFSHYEVNHIKTDLIFPGKNWWGLDEKPCSICCGRFKHDNWGVINFKIRVMAMTVMDKKSWKF